MITLKFFILVVYLLQAQRAFAFNYTIDNLKRCQSNNFNDATCFVHESCLVREHGEETDVLAHLNNVSLYKQPCDVFVLIKPLNSSKWHVMMRVTGSGLNASEGISFTQGQTQFSCKPGMAALEGELKPEPFGSGQKFSSDSMYCSIIIDANSATIADKFSSNSNKPTLVYYANDQDQKVEFASNGNAFWALPKVHCNTGKLKSENDISGNLLLHEVDTTVSLIANEWFRVCERGRSLKLRLHDKFIDVGWIECDTVKDDGSFKYGTKEGTQIIGPEIPSFGVYCAVEFCSQCSDFVFNTTCPGCTNDGVSSKQGNCKTASCPANKWRHPDGSVITSTVECKQIGNEPKSGWFMAGQSEEITGGSCADRFDCLLYSKPNFTLTAEYSFGILRNSFSRKLNSAELSDDSQTISCREGYRLKVGSTVATTLKCDQNTGYYTYEEGSAQIGANVYCETDCLIFSELDFSCSTKGCSKPTISPDNLSLSCPAGFHLRFGSNTASKLTCDPETHLYTSGKKTVNRKERVYCEKHSKHRAADSSAIEATEEEVTTTSLAIGAAIGFFVALAVFLIIVGLVVCCNRASDAQPGRSSRPSNDNSESMCENGSN